MTELLTIGRRSSNARALEALIGRIIIFCLIIALAGYAGLFYSTLNTQSIIVQIIIISWILSGPLCQWLVGRLDVLDPVALMCLFGVHFFVFGPIFQLSLSYWPFLPWTTSVESYVPIWYWWQVAFLSLGFLALRVFDSRSAEINTQQFMSVPKFREMPLILMISTLIVKLATIVMLGGFSGMIASYQARIDGGGISENNTFAGLGVVISIGNAFPIAFGYWLIWIVKNNAISKSRIFLVMFSVIIFAVSFGANGLMGSRAYVIYGIVIVMGFYHFIIRSFKPFAILGSIALLFSFSQIYYAFKFGGLEGLLSGSTSGEILKERQIDDLSNFGVIRDYTRMDVQTLAIHSIEAESTLRVWGRSYIGGLAAIVPSAIWPSRIGSFTEEKSQIIYGRADPGRITNLVFGGFGELYVNFGILSIIACPIIGAMLSIMRRRVAQAGRGINLHAAYMAPLYAILPIMLLVYDSNSLLYVLISIGLVPILYSSLSKKVLLPVVPPVEMTDERVPINEPDEPK